MSDAYKKSGVSLESGYESVRRIRKHTERTRTKGVIGNIGSFGGLFDLTPFGFKEPILVSGSDGVGTKLMLAAEMQRHDTIGQDLVAMCVNDILTAGAKPLFFQDYIACGKNDPLLIEKIVRGIADGCTLSGCAITGGETAEMPGMYRDDEYDLAGFCVGAVEKSQIIKTENVGAGDVIIGLLSSGFHSNGYSLIRKIIADAGLSLNTNYFGQNTLGEHLLEPTRIYTRSVLKVLEKVNVHSMAHITGGGFEENIPRALNNNGAQIELSVWKIPEIFSFFAGRGKISQNEMFSVFNMGIGFVIIVDQQDSEQTAAILTEAGESPVIMGRVTADPGIQYH